MLKKKIHYYLTILASIVLLCGCESVSMDIPQTKQIETSDNLSKNTSSYQIPEYQDSIYIEINNNVPSFDEDDLTTDLFEYYSDLDSLGRCGVAYANLCIDTIPTEERGEIGQIKPTGWHTIKYDSVDGKYLYNRCHLIGYQLSGENANKKNLITGTRYLNTEGMLPFENLVADYIEETTNHVLYRVTPVFTDDNLVADGVQMEVYSVEDKGAGVCFNIFVYNIQPGITIDYATGESYLSTSVEESLLENSSESNLASEVSSNTNSDLEQIEIRANSNSMIYHCPGQEYYDEMEDSKYLVVFTSEQEAIKEGYRKAKKIIYNKNK